MQLLEIEFAAVNDFWVKIQGVIMVVSDLKN